MIVTAGAIDCHVHLICPQLAYEAISSGELPNWKYFCVKHQYLTTDMCLYFHKISGILNIDDLCLYWKLVNINI